MKILITRKIKVEQFYYCTCSEKLWFFQQGCARTPTARLLDIRGIGGENDRIVRRRKSYEKNTDFALEFSIFKLTTFFVKHVSSRIQEKLCRMLEKWIKEYLEDD